MSLTVNQKTKTVEQAARSRRDFLEQLASSRAWDFRHWAKSSGMADRLHSPIEKLAVALQEHVAAAPAQTLNSNAGFQQVRHMTNTNLVHQNPNRHAALWRQETFKHH